MSERTFAGVAFVGLCVSGLFAFALFGKDDVALALGLIALLQGWRFLSVKPRARDQ